MYFHPLDVKIMSWDPEDMDSYWEKCKHYDHYALDHRNEQLELFEQISLKRYRKIRAKLA